MDSVTDHIDYVCQMAGTTRHSGVGSDLDGGFGMEQCPKDLYTIKDLQRIVVEDILSQNPWRLRKVYSKPQAPMSRTAGRPF